MNAQRVLDLAGIQVVQMAIVIVVVGMMARLACRLRWPHLAYALWLVALVKCFTPPLWASAAGVFGWTPATAPARVEVASQRAMLPFFAAEPASTTVLQQQARHAPIG